ncbi:MAG: sigma-70 family RNA polymerase sigma factor [Bacteroidales bacterium]|nr:sigma-70 family RNA polymerase sigma factor [Bacteroidales bacterium]
MKIFDKYRYSSDRQFIADLLANDGKALECLLYDRYRPLLRFNAMKAAPNVPVDDLVQELYIYLSADNWTRLKKYDPELPFDRWLSVVSYRFFKDFSLRMIDSRRQIPITNIKDQQLLNAGTIQMTHIMMDIRQGLDKLEPPRDREILTALLVHDEEPQEVADRFKVTVDNLYNIKRRALAKLIQKHLLELKIEN